MTTGFTIVVARILKITLCAIEFVDQAQREMSARPVLPFGCTFGLQQTCALRTPSSPDVRLRPAHPARYNWHSHRPSRSHDSHRAGVSAPPARGWWSSRKGLLVYVALHRFAPTSTTGCLGLGQALSTPVPVFHRSGQYGCPTGYRALNTTAAASFDHTG